MGARTFFGARHPCAVLPVVPRRDALPAAAAAGGGWPWAIATGASRPDASAGAASCAPAAWPWGSGRSGPGSAT